MSDKIEDIWFIQIGDQVFYPSEGGEPIVFTWNVNGVVTIETGTPSRK